MPYPYYEVNPKLAYGSMAALVGVLAGFAWFIKKFGPQQQRAVIFYFILFYFILFYFILFYFILFYFILFLFYFIYLFIYLT